MYDEIAPLVKRAEHESHVARVNAHGWKLPTPLPNRVRLALARSLVALAIRLAPTLTLQETRPHTRTAPDLA